MSSTATPIKPAAPKKSPVQKLSSVWPEIRSIVMARKWLFLGGLGLMVVNRVCGLVLPGSIKYLIDDVVGKRHIQILLPLVAIVVTATALQGISSFALTQLLSKAAQRLITDMRRKVQVHIGLLPVSYYDVNKTGSLVSRVMSDVEGVRNLLGTGMVDFLGGLLTSVIAFFALLHISTVMTILAFSLLAVFAVAVMRAFQTVRPIFRERSKIYGEVSGRLAESLGGVRVVKGYHAEEREAGVFSTGVQRLLENILRTLTATSVMGLASSVLLGIIGAMVMYVGGRQMLAGKLTTGDFISFNMFLVFLAAPIVQIVSIGTQLN